MATKKARRDAKPSRRVGRKLDGRAGGCRVRRGQAIHAQEDEALGALVERVVLEFAGEAERVGAVDGDNFAIALLVSAIQR